MESTPKSKTLAANDSKLLGYGKPINFLEEGLPKWEAPFPNAIEDWAGNPLTLGERRMIAFMGEITEKPDWKTKIFDDKILSKWREERAEQEADTEPMRALTEEMFEYCIEELREYAEVDNEMRFHPAIDATAAVYKSDILIPDHVRTALIAAVMPLEQVEARDQDWHPNSDEKVLDLVHPSLFPLLYGRSRILPNGPCTLDDCIQHVGKGEVMPIPEEEHLKISTRHLDRHVTNLPAFYSSRFQWLPCEVTLNADASVKITSYINNLHPVRHRDVYHVLEAIIPKVIPMWDATLASLDRDWLEPRMNADDVVYNDPDEERPPESDEEDLNEGERAYLDEEWAEKNRTFTIPDPPEFSTRKISAMPESSANECKPVSLRKQFGSRGLQIIVKLANIHLTPEKPTYEGGSWHIEGQLNEHICASALYYYSTSNITQSQLSFRERRNTEYFEDASYEQGEFRHYELLYDFANGEDDALQFLGSVKTDQNRLLTFPNVFQHRVNPFELEDKTQPGHRKILALFLVDPNVRIPSTAHVSPQQKDWWRDMVLGLDRVGSLPPELAERVVNSSEGLPIDLEEAKEIRLQLMEERKAFVKDVDGFIEEGAFNFCEH